MDTLKELDIVRGLPTVRAASVESGMPTMDVRFSPFGTWYEIDSWYEGRFLERTSNGAFLKTISEGWSPESSRIKVLFDHGYDASIGNKVLGPISDLREDADSAIGVVPLFDTSYNRDLVPGLSAGVYGSSFRMRVIQDAWNDDPGISAHNPLGIPERTIIEVRLFEFGPVTFPANPDATSALRCMTDAYYSRMRSAHPEKVDDLLSRARALRTPQGAASETERPESSDHHRNGMSASARARAFVLMDLPTRGVPDGSGSGTDRGRRRAA